MQQLSCSTGSNDGLMHCIGNSFRKPQGILHLSFISIHNAGKDSAGTPFLIPFGPCTCALPIAAGNYVNDFNEFFSLGFMNNFPRLVSLVIKRFFQQNCAVFYACYYGSAAQNFSKFKLIYLP
jgi:hypothetical protein